MKTEQALVKIEETVLTQALTYPAKAQALVVTNDEELETADAFVKGAKALIKEIRDGYDDVISDAHSTWKGAIAKRDHYLKPVSESVDIAKGKMAPYMEEQARKQREAEEALRRAEEEAEEKERLAEEERQRKAREALQDGDTEAANNILAEPEPEIIPEKVDIPQVKKLEGTHTRTDWMWEEMNESVVIDGTVPREFLMLDGPKITAYVKKHKEKAKIAGIKIFPKTIISTRG